MRQNKQVKSGQVTEDNYLTNGKLFHYGEPVKCRSLVFVVIAPMAVILICHASHRCTAVEAKNLYS